MRRPAASPRTPARQAWSDAIEAQTQATAAALLLEARRNTRRARHDTAFLETLAHELTLARSGELTQAYRNLVWLTPGFRRRNLAGQVRLTREVCVVLVVRRKRTMEASHPQHLPRWLITYADLGGVRQPFALRTDVQEAARYHRARAHADCGVWLRKPGWGPTYGHLTCLVRLRSDAGIQICALSAQHVLSPYADGSAVAVPSGLAVWPLDAQGARATAPSLAASLPYGGRLRDDERWDRPSFDVQLAKLAAGQAAAVRAHIAFRNINPGRPWIRSRTELSQAAGTLQLLPPQRDPLRLILASMPAAAHGISYTFSGTAGGVPHQVYHRELLQFEACGPGPLPGDSGSPIVLLDETGRMTLVGMHIGGDTASSWAIPAWCLFDLESNWLDYPHGASLELIEP